MSDTRTTKFDFMKPRKVFGWISTVLLIISVVLLGVRGLNWGLDFTGGTSVEIEYVTAPDLEDVREHLATAGYDNFVVQNFGSDRLVLIRLQEAGDENLGRRLVGDLQDRSETDVRLVSSEFVGSQVGDELKENSGIAMLLALVITLIYVGMRFQLKFGIASVLPLAHDVILLLGMFALFQWTFDLTVLAALMAVIGYSLNDSIVIMDRIRENFRKLRIDDPEETVNRSIHETINRTINTSVSTLLVLIALYFLGGDAINLFALTLSFGVVIGSYSSVYISANLLIAMGVSRTDLIVPAKEGAGGESDEEEEPPEWLKRM